MNFDEAAAVPLVAQTAYQGMFEHAKLQEGETADKADFLKSLGANQVIDYRTEKWQDVGAQNVLKKGTGHFVTILPMVQHVKESEFGAKLVGHVHVDPSAKTLREISKYIESGKKALEAYTKLKSRHALGKLVVKVFRC
ncbi:NAD(P)-binding domain [Phytophthora cactorum]|nr:NAD(P)-binding domain [Phytophthora cactorum]